MINEKLIDLCKENQTEEVNKLLERKKGEIRADINFKGEGHWTALHFAVRNQNMSLVHNLIYK